MFDFYYISSSDTVVYALHFGDIADNVVVNIISSYN